MNQKYLPVQTVATINDVDVEKIKKLYHNSKYLKKSDDRFKVIDGKLHALAEYQYPLAIEVEELRDKAMIIASNENRLCKELSTISKISPDTLRKYFYRFTFKHIELAKNIIKALNLYIERNSLFPAEELCYGY